MWLKKNINIFKTNSKKHLFSDSMNVSIPCSGLRRVSRLFFDPLIANSTNPRILSCRLSILHVMYVCIENNIILILQISVLHLSVVDGLRDKKMFKLYHHMLSKINVTIDHLLVAKYRLLDINVDSFDSEVMFSNISRLFNTEKE